MISISNCPFTGRKATVVSHDQEALVYTIPFRSRALTIRACRKCLTRVVEKRLTREYQAIISGLILNNKLHLDTTELIHWDDKEERVKEGKYNLMAKVLALDYPKSPDEKIDNLFKRLYQGQPSEGELFSVDITNDTPNEFYFKSTSELHTYLYALERRGLIDKLSLTYATFALKFTFEGLSEFVNLSKNGYNSNKCFIAMSFSEGLEPIRNAIVKAINDTGFTPLIVDKIHIDSDRTINDAIFAGLKECKFCIADFCEHKNGVYLEAGFALGLGKKVIYTCSKEEFGKAHFDIRPLQQIIYGSPEELTERLIDKIKAWIVD